jgi:thiosulfate reductase cytochrome b subunit
MSRGSSFVRWALYLGSGLLIWVAQFLFSYVLAALACARGFADESLAGMGVVPLGVSVASLIAIAGCGGVMYQALARSRRAGGDETARFLHFVAGAVAAFALTGIGWTALAGALPLQCPH